LNTHLKVFKSSFKVHYISKYSKFNYVELFITIIIYGKSETEIIIFESDSIIPFWRCQHKKEECRDLIGLEILS